MKSTFTCFLNFCFSCFNIMSNDINFVAFFVFAFSRRALGFHKDWPFCFFFSSSVERVSGLITQFVLLRTFKLLFSYFFESFRSAINLLSFLLSYALCSSLLGFIQVDLESTSLHICMNPGSAGWLENSCTLHCLCFDSIINLFDMPQ